MRGANERRVVFSEEIERADDSENYLNKINGDKILYAHTVCLPFARVHCPA